MGRRQAKRKTRTLRTESYGKGSIYQDKGGRWYYQPPPKDGKRLKRIRAADEQSAKLAQADHLKERAAKIDHTEAQTVESWLNFWFTEHILPDIKPKTAEWYRYLIRMYILPAIGRIRLLDLNADHLILLQNQLRAGGLSNRTIARIDALLARALKKAVVSRKILYNPMEAIDMPRVPRSKQEALTAKEVTGLLRSVQGGRLELLYDLALLQGLRKGELLGLLISEYDRAKGTIKVSGQVQTIDGRTSRQGSPKSENSIRELPITTRQRVLIEAHLDRLREERNRLGVDWKEQGLLFPNERGGPLHPSYIWKQFKAALKRAGIEPKGVRFHDLRHTCATLLISQGVHLSVVKERMRHSQISVTADTYGHIFEETQRAAGELLGSLFVAPESVLLELRPLDKKSKRV